MPDLFESKELGFPLYPAGTSHFFGTGGLINVGVVMESIEPGQLFIDVLHSVQDFKRSPGGERASFVFFTEKPNKAQIGFPCFNVAELEGFYGHCISTTMNTTAIAINIPNISRIYHYMYDLEWTRPHRRFSPEKYHKILTCPKVKMYCRGEEHAQAIYSSFNLRPESKFITCNIGGIMQDIYQELKNAG